jgi:4-hydroxy-tetrahydrodipicolinate synthase
MPQETHDIVMKYLNGEVEESRRIQLGLNKLINSLFIETNPIPVKTCMNMMGFEVGELRMPLYEMADCNKEKLRQAMNEIGLVRR